jgi:hypothetical protein
MNSPQNIIKKGKNTPGSKSPPIKKVFQMSAKNSSGGGVFSSFNKTAPDFASPIDFKMSKTGSDFPCKLDNQALT